jgi:hypothetical protein
LHSLFYHLLHEGFISFVLKNGKKNSIKITIFLGNVANLTICISIDGKKAPYNHNLSSGVFFPFYERKIRQVAKIGHKINFQLPSSMASFCHFSK